MFDPARRGNFLIETRSSPALTHVFPDISTSRFSHLCRQRPRSSIRSLLPRSFAFYVADPSAPLKLARLPGSLAPTLVALPSMSLFPGAPLKLARLPACSLLPSSLYLLCRFSQALHCILLAPARSTATFAASPAMSLTLVAPFLPFCFLLLNSYLLSLCQKNIPLRPR
jgi:hypothetical protein